jgi:hypothetical protein
MWINVPALVSFCFFGLPDAFNANPAAHHFRPSVVVRNRRAMQMYLHTGRR